MDTHEAVCLVRYDQIRTDIGAIRSIMKWVATIVVMTFISMSGWTATQWFRAENSQLDAARAQQEAQRAQLSLLQSQMTNLASALKPNGAVTINQNPTATPSEPGAPQ